MIPVKCRRSSRFTGFTCRCLGALSMRCTMHEMSELRVSPELARKSRNKKRNCAPMRVKARENSGRPDSASQFSFRGRAAERNCAAQADRSRRVFGGCLERLRPVAGMQAVHFGRPAQGVGPIRRRWATRSRQGSAETEKSPSFTGADQRLPRLRVAGMGPAGV